MVAITSDFDVEVIIPLISIQALPNLVFMFVGSSSHTPYAKGVEDFFSRLNLDHAPFCFPNLNREKRKIMDVILQERSTLGFGRLEVYLG
jgi:hypothetical protein